MKTLSITYQLYVVCQQEIEVPDDYQIIKGDGWEQIQDLRESFPDDDIWDTIPDSDGNGDVQIEDHLDYISGVGLDIPKKHTGGTGEPQFIVEELKSKLL